MLVVAKDTNSLHSLNWMFKLNSSESATFTIFVGK